MPKFAVSRRSLVVHLDGDDADCDINRVGLQTAVGGRTEALAVTESEASAVPRTRDNPVPARPLRERPSDVSAHIVDRAERAPVVEDRDATIANVHPLCAPRPDRAFLANFTRRGIDSSARSDSAYPRQGLHPAHLLQWDRHAIASSTHSNPCASATARCTTFPATRLTPFASVGFWNAASRQPRFAISSAYAMVALVKAYVEV